MKSVSIILVNYNGFNDTKECIESLEKIKYDNYNVIIVDNCSREEDYKNILKEFNNNINLHIIRSDVNLGFAGGNNLGIRYALESLNSEYILLLNNDTLVEKNFLIELVKRAENNKDVGIVGSKIYYYPEKDKIWYAGGRVNWKRIKAEHIGEKQEDNSIYNVEKEVDFISGCAMLIKSEVIKKVGVLPEEYFMYYEDLDYCITVAEQGYKLIYNPNSIIYHKVSASSGGEESPFLLKYGIKNRIYFLKKFKNKFKIFEYYKALAFIYIWNFIKIFKFIIARDKLRIDAIKEGLFTK